MNFYDILLARCLRCDRPYPKSASGSIITITDGAGNMPLLGAVVNIEPAQDLHGYDSPWPAGGGYNILPDGNTISKLNDAGLTVTLTDTTLSGYTATKVAVTGTAASWGWRIYTSGIRSVLQPETAYKITFLASAAYTFAGMIATTGSASKLCGNINFTRTQLSNGLYEYAGTFTTYASTDAGWSVSDQVLLLYLNPATTSPVDFTIVNGICLTASTAPDGYYAYSNICPISGWSEVNVWVKPTYDTSLTPTATIPLGRTVYCGTLDVLVGAGKSRYDIDNMRSINPNYIQPYTYGGKNGVVLQYQLGTTQTRAKGWCNMAPVSTEADYNSNQYMWFGVNSSHVFWIGILDALNMTLDEFKTWFSANDVIICRPLASPTTFSVTPQTIRTLWGTNNIWADAGDTSVEYVAVSCCKSGSEEEPLEVTDNGQYIAPEGKAFNPVTVNVPLPSGTLPITENGIYGVYSYASVDVDVAGGISADDIAMRSISGAIVGSSASIVDEYAFYSCTSLTEVSFPACASIGSYAFCGCTSLTEVSFPACTNINGSAFSGCTSLTEVSFPACTNISGSAFYGCTSLTEVSFPACTKIETSAFRSCTSLTEVSFPACTSIAQGAFYSCFSLTEANFPACTYIETSAFQGCYSLAEVSFPACTKIGSYAFRSCYNLLSFNLVGVSSVPVLSGTSVFQSTPIGGYTGSTGGVYGSVYVPSSLLTAFQTAPNWSLISSRIVGV